MTRIQWTADVELQVMENENDSYNEIVKLGEMDDVDIVNETAITADIQFACGDVVYSVNKSLFLIVPA